MSHSFLTPWTVACQTHLSMGFPRQEYWNGLPFPFSGDLSDSGIELELPALAGRFFMAEPPGQPPVVQSLIQIQHFFFLCNIVSGGSYYKIKQTN